MFFKKKQTVNNVVKREYEPYWQQRFQLERVENRLDYFIPLCTNKKVIHFGCTDFPIFNPSNNLHIILNKFAKELHGFDIDVEGIDKLREFVNQEYFSRFEDVVYYNYDVCLIPETIEHVDNIKEFLTNLRHVNAKTFVITAPNCFVQEHFDRNLYEEGFYTEIVHPDHNCWFSPYTLKNVIEKYSPLQVVQSYLLQSDRMVCCEAIKKS